MAERCQLILAYTVAKMPDVERNASIKVARKNADFKCGVTALQSEVASANMANTPATAGYATRTMDWIDSTWADNSFWNDPDTYPTFDDDLTFLDSWHSSINAAINGSTSLTDAQSGISSLLASASLTDPLHAAWAAEAAALTTASVTYWNAHLDEWRDQFCDDDPPQDVLGVRSDDPCDEDLEDGNGPSPRDGSWDAIKGFGLADVNSYVTIGVEIYNGYKSVRDNWAQVGRYINGASGLVRLTYPTTRQMVVMGAKGIGRFSILGLVGTALMDSAIQSWQ